MKIIPDWLKPSPKYHTFLMDENVKMSDEDISSIPNHKIINSTDKFKKGTADEVLTFWAQKERWIIVTKDIRMALRSLIDGVAVIFISDDFKKISYLNVQIYGRGIYPEMYDYLEKRFAFNK